MIRLRLRFELRKAAPAMKPEFGKVHLVKKMIPIERGNKTYYENRWVMPDEGETEGVTEHSGHWINASGHRMFVTNEDKRTIGAVADKEKSGKLVGTQLNSSLHKRYLQNIGDKERTARSKDVDPESAAKKFGRVGELAAKMPDVIKNVDTKLMLPDHEPDRVTATALNLMISTGMRIGNAESAKMGHFGATTLTRKHITNLSDDSVRIQFTGKSGVAWDVELKGKEIAGALKEFVRTAGPDEPLLKMRKGDKFVPLSDKKLRGIVKESGFLPHDIRRWNASERCFHELSQHKGGMSEKEAKAAVNAAVQKVADQLFHEPEICRKSYISPAIIEDFIKNGGKLSTEAPIYATDRYPSKEKSADKSAATTPESSDTAKPEQKEQVNASAKA